MSSHLKGNHQVHVMRTNINSVCNENNSFIVLDPDFIDTFIAFLLSVYIRDIKLHTNPCNYKHSKFFTCFISSTLHTLTHIVYDCICCNPFGLYFTATLLLKTHFRAVCQIDLNY